MSPRKAKPKGTEPEREEYGSIIEKKRKEAKASLGRQLGDTVKEAEKSYRETVVKVREMREEEYRKSRFLDVKLFPKQAKAFAYLQDSTTNEVLYGGGARGGKSRLLATWLAVECISKPGSSWLLGRNELKRLQQTTLLELLEVLNELGLPKEAYNYNIQQSLITFSNGSRIFLYDLGYMPSDPNYDRIGSLNLTGAAIDEAQEVQYKVINVLRGRFSLVEKWGWKTIPKILMTCNPSRNWIYTEYYKPWKAGTLPNERKFIPALVGDNPTVPQSYIDFLRKSDPITVARLLDGNFEYEDDPNVLFQAQDVATMFENGKKPPARSKRIITADVARFGKDSTVISIWEGLHCQGIIQKRKLNTQQVASELRDIASRYGVDMEDVVVDEDGVGGGVVDTLGCRGFVNNSKPLSPYASSVQSYLKRNFANLKSQCYWLFSQLVQQGLVSVKAEGEIKEKLAEELTFIRYKSIDTDDKIALESKQDMKERLGRSPDLADALMFRFVYELLQNPSLDSEIKGKSPEDNPYKRMVEEHDELVAAFEQKEAELASTVPTALSSLPFTSTI